MALSRRSVLGAAGALAGGGVIGYRATSVPAPSGSAPTPGSLDGETVYVDDALTLPETDADRTDDPADATVAVYPTGSTDRVADTLGAATPAVVVGPDALGTLVESCRRLDTSYGFCGRSWGSDTLVAAAVPRDGWLETHVYVGATLPRDLPWALTETLHLRYPDCSVPFEAVQTPDDAVFAGLARVRGHTAVGGFDRRDRVYHRERGDASAVFVETDATIRSGAEADGDERYVADSVELSAEFDAPLDAVGPGARSTDALTVRDRSTADDARQVFTAESDAARAAFTACSRRRVVPDSLGDPFEYIANARFTWRNPQFLRADATAVHHTPGGAFWSL